jgi:hypothetical protein
MQESSELGQLADLGATVTPLFPVAYAHPAPQCCTGRQFRCASSPPLSFRVNRLNEKTLEMTFFETYNKAI